MNPNLMHQMAQDRRADLLRQAQEYRRAGPTARPTVLSRVTARLPRFPRRSHHQRTSARAAHPRPPRNPAVTSQPTTSWPISTLLADYAEPRAIDEPKKPAPLLSDQVDGESVSA
jgi:hypothetical protein